MIQEIIDFLNTYIKAHGCTEMNKWVEFLEQLGWHPASEPPKEEEEVIAAGDYDITRAVFHEGEYYIARYYYDPKSLNCALNGVNYWCYPPEKDN